MPARRTYPLAKMDPSIMKTTFRFGSPCQLTVMLLLLYCRTVSGGRAADSVGVPPEGSAAEAIVSEARLSLAEFGVGLISLPGKLLSGAADVVSAPLEKAVGVKHMPTGINGLSPRSPLLRGLDTLAIHAPYHTIVGDHGKGDTMATG
jgi:hypothetical protein